MRALAIVLFCAAAAAQSPCGVEGTVRNGVTGEPVVNATLKLRRGTSTFVTETDSKGQYAFAGIEPGSYTLSASRLGFLDVNYGARKSLGPGLPFALEAGKTLAGVDFRLTPAAAISGVVRKADGDPLVNGTVVASRQGYVNGRKGLISVGNSNTDDLGAYRIYGLPPGKYVVSAELRGLSSGPESLDPAPASLLKTYYPSTPDAQRADPLDVQPGKTATGINLTMASAPVSRTPGKIENISEVARDTRYMSVVVFQEGSTALAQTQVDLRTGEFQLPAGLRPGKYWLFYTAERGGATNPEYHQIVEYGGGSLTLAFKPGVTLSASVRLEPGAAPAALQRTRVSLSPREMPALTMVMLGSFVGADGRLSIANIPPGVYDLNVDGAPAGMYVRSARIGDSDALAQPLDFTKGAPGALEITLGTNTGTVQGSVKDAGGAASVGVRAALVPQEPWRQGKRESYKVATTDASGKFTMTAVPPGEYKLYAWEEVDETAWLDPDFLKPLQQNATPVTVRESATETAEVRVIPGV
jgi:hypothetical protein